MKKILFNLAALAALSMVAVGCKKPTDSAKEQQKKLNPPKTYAVTIDGTGVQPRDYTVAPATLTGLSGSQTITITPAAGKKLTVKKGSTAVNAGSDGKFKVQVSGATTITVDVVITPPVSANATIDATNKIITIEFDQALDSASFDNSKVTVQKGSAAQAGGTAAVNGKTLTITYSTPLTSGTYNITIAAGAVGAAADPSKKNAEITKSVTVS